VLVPTAVAAAAPDALGMPGAGALTPHPVPTHAAGLFVGALEHAESASALEINAPRSPRASAGPTHT